MRSAERKEQAPNFDKVKKMKEMLSLVVDVSSSQFQVLAGQLGWYIYHDQSITDPAEKLNNFYDAFLLLSQALPTTTMEETSAEVSDRATKSQYIDLQSRDITHYLFYIFDSLKRELLKTEESVGLRGDIDLTNLALNEKDFTVLNHLLDQLKNSFGIQASVNDFRDYMAGRQAEEEKKSGVSLSLDSDIVKKPISLMDFIHFLKKCFSDMKKNPSESFLIKLKHRIEELAEAVPTALALFQPGTAIDLKKELKPFLPVEPPAPQVSVVDTKLSQPDRSRVQKKASLRTSLDLDQNYIADNLLKLPDCKVGQALQGSDSFFDSAVQAIYQVTYDTRGFIKKLQELGMDSKEIEEKLSKVPVELRAAKLFRMLCSQYALQKMQDKKQNWLKEYIEAERAKTGESLEDYLRRMESTQSELSESKRYSTQRSIEGRPEIEGRILCNLFEIKINVVEQDPQGQFHQQLFDEKSIVFEFGMPKFKMINLAYADGQFVPILTPSQFNIDKEIAIELDSLKERNQSAASRAPKLTQPVSQAEDKQSVEVTQPIPKQDGATILRMSRDEKIAYYGKRAEMGDHEAMLWCAQFSTKEGFPIIGEFILPSSETVTITPITYMKKLAEVNHPQSLYEFGLYAKTGMLFGVKVPTTFSYAPEVAKNYFERAAALGHAEAMLELGNCYEQGFGAAKNQDKANECFIAAAELATQGKTTLVLETKQDRAPSDQKSQKRA